MINTNSVMFDRFFYITLSSQQFTAFIIISCGHVLPWKCFQPLALACVAGFYVSSKAD